MPTQNHSLATFDLDALLEQLGSLVKNSPTVLFDKALIDEKDFYVCVFQIRKCAPRLFVSPNSQSFALLEEIENLAENSKLHFLGKTLIDRVLCQTLIEALRQTIANERQVVEISIPQTQADEIIRIAQMQAQSILEAAHQEAQRIIEKAKNQVN